MRTYQQVLVVSLWIIVGAFALWGFNSIGLLSSKGNSSSIATLEIDFPEAYEIWRKREAIFVDARPPAAFKRGHIPRAVNVPLRSAEQALSKLSIPRNENLILYCTGVRCPNARQLMDLLLRLGYMNVRVLPRGIKVWKTLGYPLEKGASKAQ